MVKLTLRLFSSSVVNEKIRKENKNLRHELMIKSALLEEKEAESQKLIVVEKDGDIPLEKELELL